MKILRTLKKSAAQPKGLLALCAFLCSQAAFSAPVVLMYHRFDNTATADTAVTPTAFEHQLDYMKTHGINVMSSTDLVDDLQSGKAVPPHTVVITIDDGWKSVLKVKPVLDEDAMPFTIALYTQMQEEKVHAYLSDDDVRALAHDPLCTIANHSYSHDAGVMSGRKGDMKADLERAQTYIQRVTGQSPSIFVYPYGIVNAKLRKTLTSMDFKGAFTTSAGPVQPNSDLLKLPRYLVHTEADFERAMSVVESDNVGPALSSQPHAHKNAARHPKMASHLYSHA
jgi:peptidoglycan/xylan/chitin deacetylase (PgdA/CDA1 family)